MCTKEQSAGKIGNKEHSVEKINTKEHSAHYDKGTLQV